MNRIGGPSALPHSRTCSRRPPPPFTVWIFVVVAPLAPLSSLASSCSSCRCRSWPCEELERIGRSALSSAAGLRIFRSPGAYERLPRRRRYWPDGGSRERVFVGRARELGGARARARRDAGGERRDRPRRRRSGHRQDPARVRARDARPRRGVRGPARALDRSRRHGAAVPAVRRGPASARRASAGRRQAAGSQLRVFEETLALLTERAAAAPVLLVLEDLHWADTSTLDLVVFLAHNLDDRRVLLLATYRADELVVGRAHAPARRRRPALGLGARARARAARARGADGAARGPRRRSAAGGADGRDRRPLRRQPLLRRRAPRRRRRPAAASSRVACATCCCSAWPGSTAPTQSLLRLAAAAGRDVGYPLLRAVAALPERDVRESLRQAVEHGVLVAEQATGSFRFRHALLAEAIYATILPGEREELHARLADELARSGAASPAELAPHWAAAGRSAGGARRVGRSGTPGGGRLRPRGGSRAPRAGARAVARRARTRPSSPGSTSPSSAPGRPSSPAKSAPRRARSSSHGERSSSSARKTRTVRRSSTCASASTSTRPAATTRCSPRSSARSSSCRRSRPRRSARMRWGHSPGG